MLLNDPEEHWSRQNAPAARALRFAERISNGVSAVELGSTNVSKRAENPDSGSIRVAGVVNDAIGHCWWRKRHDRLFNIISQRASDRVSLISKQMC